jgi:hypothetical protein
MNKIKEETESMKTMALAMTGLAVKMSGKVEDIQHCRLFVEQMCSKIDKVSHEVEKMNQVIKSKDARISFLTKELHKMKGKLKKNEEDAEEEIKKMKRELDCSQAALQVHEMPLEDLPTSDTTTPGSSQDIFDTQEKPADNTDILAHSDEDKEAMTTK